MAERRADGQVSEQDWQDAKDIAHSARWSAEVDTFGYDPATFPGSNWRYAAAGAIEHTTEDQPDHIAEFMFHYRWYMKFDETSRESLHPDNGARACMLARDIFGNPFRPVEFKRRWESGEVLNLASKIHEERAYHLMPSLGNALKTAGCKESGFLEHCFQRHHTRGCWVVDKILGKV